jgi:flagellar biosynthesis regulator FlbT
MALKLTVKPGETFFVGNAEISVQSDAIVSVLVGGKAPVLRSEDHISEDEANSPALRLQYIVQQMYLSGDITGNHVAYFEAAQSLIAAHPEHQSIVSDVNSLLMQGAAYKAIKLIKCISSPEMTENRARLRLVS